MLTRECLYYILSGDLQSANMLISTAIHIVSMFGGHISPDSEPSLSNSSRHVNRKLRTTLHVRGLFWVCYSLDVDLALWTGYPTKINTQNCDLTLPPRFEEAVRTFAVGGIRVLKDSEFTPLYASDLRLIPIKSRIYDALYSVNALRKSDADLLREIREIDYELEQWRLCLPPCIRPSLGSSKCKLSARDFNMRAIMINLQYHHAISLIHRATGRCEAWKIYKSGDMDGVSSSLALSVEASRSTLFFLKSAVNDIRDDHFWYERALANLRGTTLFTDKLC